MTTSDKLFISKLSFAAFAGVLMLIGYAICVAYSNEIESEIARLLNDSFGHLKGELAGL